MPGLAGTAADPPPDQSMGGHYVRIQERAFYRSARQFCYSPRPESSAPPRADAIPNRAALRPPPADASLGLRRGGAVELLCVSGMGPVAGRRSPEARDAALQADQILPSVGFRILGLDDLV